MRKGEAPAEPMPLRLGRNFALPINSWRNDDFEVRTFDFAEFFMQDGNARIGSDRDGPFDAVVGEIGRAHV